MTEPRTRFDDPTYEAFAAIVRERSGLIFPAARRAVVETAATRVMRRVGVPDPTAFLPLIAEGGAVFDDLMIELTIGETYFFRESAHFALLRETIIPDFVSRRVEGQKLRAWSAGCSTGEEPYSVAIALRENGIDGAILGTDVNRARLSAARRGEYRRWSFRGVPDATIKRYFSLDGDVYAITPDVRRAVEFRYLNLAADSYPSVNAGVWGMDVIFCRNVLIYFDRATIQHVAASLLASLSPDGWLLLGATDPPLHEYVPCEVVQTKAGLVYRPPRGTRARTVIAPAARPAPVVSMPPLVAPPIAAPAAPAAPLPAPPQVREPERTPAPAPFTAEEAYAAHDYERVITLLETPAAHGSARLDELIILIRALANLGRLAEAGRVCAGALDVHRDSAELHYLHAVLLAQAGKHSESARAAKRAIYLDRSMVVAHLALGAALAREHDAAGATRAFAAAERLLGAMPADSIVPGTDGETTERLREMTRTQSRNANREDAA